MRWGVFGLIAALFVLAGAAAWVLRDRLPYSGAGAQLVFLVMAGVLVGAGLFARGGLGPDWLRNLALWVAIFAGTAIAVTVLAPGFR